MQSQIVKYSNEAICNQFDIKIRSNMTILDLKLEVAKVIKHDWNKIQLRRQQQFPELVDSDNGRTIGEVKMRNGECLNVFEKDLVENTDPILIGPDKELLPHVLKVFQDLFAHYSANQKMDMEQLAQFVSKCCYDKCGPQDAM